MSDDGRMDDMGDDYGADEDQYDPDEMIGCAHPMSVGVNRMLMAGTKAKRAGRARMVRGQRATRTR